MQRIVALKVIKKEVATEQFITRFRREIRLSARLIHPNVVVAYDADHCPLGDFLVMEYVDGASLKDVIEKSKTLSVAESVSFVRQAAQGLAYAHRQGVVHRDIKPANLLLDLNGCLKVADLGLARVSEWEHDSGGLSASNHVVGTVDYMSPEQGSNPMDVDARSDIYSLGCTLFYLLTGGPMFERRGLVQSLMAHRSEVPPQLTDLRSDVTPGLNAIFQRMVAKKANDRYATMEDLIEALDQEFQPSKTEVAAAPETWSLADASILIVEESRMLAQVLQQQLQGLGITQIQKCRSGKEASELIKTAPPQVLVASFQLPDMSGLELANHLRELRARQRSAIVLLSGDDWTPEVRTAARQLGRVRLLKKPFQANSLQEAIEGAISGSEQYEPLNGLSNLQVLLVDDSSLARRQVRKTLTELGFANFTEADDGDVAVELLRNNRFDLVITDYNMDRMDGRQLIAHIRNESSQRDLPIVMVTTEFDPQKLAAIYQLGVSAICNKSFERELVRNIVVQIFGRRA